ncbi:MAG: homoserine dehydrogenase, partial [bacterium]|nr:homoserine dehydrogenase [bacterium]
MRDVSIGVVGLGTIGTGTLHILAGNAEQIELKLGFRLRVKAVCDLLIDQKEIPAPLGAVERFGDWRQVVTHPEVDIVVELVGGTTVAGEIIETAIANKKSIVTANKALMGLRGPDIWDQAIQAGINLAMEASVAGGIPIHAVLREGISGDRVSDLY